MKNPYIVTVVGTDGTGKKVYGVTYREKIYQHIGMPESWGSRAHANAYLRKCLLFIGPKDPIPKGDTD